MLRLLVGGSLKYRFIVLAIAKLLLIRMHRSLGS